MKVTQGLELLMASGQTIQESFDIYFDFERQYYAKHKEEYITGMESGHLGEFFNTESKVWDRYVRKRAYRNMMSDEDMAWNYR